MKEIKDIKVDTIMTKHKMVFIKILPSSLLENWVAQNWHGLDDGDIIQAIEITDEMRERAKAKGAAGDNLGTGYIILGWGFCHKALATEEITDADYRKYIKRLGEKQAKKIKEKTELDRSLNFISRELILLRKRRKALK